MKTLTLADIARTMISGTVEDLSPEHKAEQRKLRAASPTFAAEEGVLVPFFNDWEKRALSATGQTSTSGDQGGMTIPVGVPEIGTALRGNLVLERLGARVYAGLTQNINLPTENASTQTVAGWLSENAANTTASDLFQQLNLKPLRVNAWIDVSVQLLDQVDLFNDFVTRMLTQALAIEIQRAAINGSGASNQPTGILNVAGTVPVYAGGAANNATNPNGAAPVGADICNLEYSVTGLSKADRGNVGWITSPWVRRKLRQVSIITGGGWPIMDNEDADVLLGRPAGFTPSSPDTLTKGTSSNCSAIICGEFSELFLGLWGAGVVINATKDLTVYAQQGLIRMNATAYFNVGVRTPTAFAVCKDALCA